MTDHPLLTAWLGIVAAQAPSTMTALAICLWAVLRRDRIGGALIWTLLGFGLLVAANLFSPATHFLLQQWGVARYLPFEEMSRYFMALNLAWSGVYAASYVFLTLAIFAGHRTLGPGSPPPLPNLKADPVISS